MCVGGPLVRRTACICRSLEARLGSELSSALSCVWALIICHKTPTATSLRRQISHASLALAMSRHRKLVCAVSPTSAAIFCSFTTSLSSYLLWAEGYYTSLTAVLCQRWRLFSLVLAYFIRSRIDVTRLAIVFMFSIYVLKLRFWVQFRVYHSANGMIERQGWLAFRNNIQ